MSDEGEIKKNDEDVKNVHDIVSRKVSTGGKPADKTEEVLFQAYNDGHEFARIMYAQMLAENCPDEALTTFKAFLDCYEQQQQQNKSA